MTTTTSPPAPPPAASRDQTPPRKTHARDPTQTHFVIAALEASLVPVPEPLFPPASGYTYELRSYPLTRPDQVPERIADADILIFSVLALPRALLTAEICPRLKHVAVVASGTDSVDKQACAERGIVVSNTPHCNTTSVAEHVVASYFALRRSLVLAHEFTQAGEWGKGGNAKSSFVLDGKGDGKPPRTCGSEVLGIVGHGGVGRKVERLARALGMEVLISGRKLRAAPGGGGADGNGGSRPAGEDVGPGRTPFDKLLATASVVVLCCPRSPDTLDLISSRELALMPRHALLVNVSRGGVVDEPAVLAALRAGEIGGYATDVFLKEPANAENNVLIGEETTRGLNILTTPHVAWCAEETNDAYNAALLANLEGWLLDGGRPKYPVLSYA